MISPNFPKIGEVNVAHVNPLSNVIKHGTPTPGKMSPCGCLKREWPPPPPTSLLFPASEENRAKLQQFLLDYYKSSTFNTCEHQALPMMEVPPLRLMVDKCSTPVAFHKPIPVPLH